MREYGIDRFRGIDGVQASSSLFRQAPLGVLYCAYIAKRIYTVSQKKGPNFETV